MQKKYADKVHFALMTGIMEGRFRAGDVLKEEPLAEEFQVSRTPIREALQRLAAEGLVERGQRRAFTVCGSDRKMLDALFEAMGEIEALIARLAALRMSEMQRQALLRIVSEGEAPEADYGLANERFHLALREGAQNPVLASLCADLQLRTMTWRGAQFRKSGERIRSSQAEHRQILAAVMEQDGAGAARLMRAHVAASLDTVLHMVEEKNPR